MCCLRLLNFREKLELWLPNGLAAPNSIDLSNLGKKSSYQTFNKPKKRPVIPKNDSSRSYANDTDIASEVENTRIKIEALDTKIDTLSGSKTVPRDLYEPSFNGQKSVSRLSYNDKVQKNNFNKIRTTLL